MADWTSETFGLLVTRVFNSVSARVVVPSARRARTSSRRAETLRGSERTASSANWREVAVSPWLK